MRGHNWPALHRMKIPVRPELPTASVGSSQAPTAAVDNSAPLAIRPQSTFKIGECCSNKRSHFSLLVHLATPLGDDQVEFLRSLEQVSQLISQGQSAIKASKDSNIASLPQLTAVQDRALRSVDLQLSQQELSLCMWLQSSLVCTRKSFRFGDLGELDSTYFMTFRFRDELDRDATGLYFPLQLRYRFPPMKVLRLAAPRRHEDSMPALFKISIWSNFGERASVPIGLQSELLNAFLEVTPEIAHLSQFIVSFSLRLEKSNSEWFAALRPEGAVTSLQQALVLRLIRWYSKVSLVWLALLGLAVLALGVAVIVIAAPSLGIGLTLPLLQPRIGSFNGTQARLPAFDLRRNIQFRLVLLRLVCAGRLLKQCRNYALSSASASCMRP